MNTTAKEDINALLEDGYKFDDDIIPAPENKPITTEDTDWKIHKDVWKCNVI